MTPAEIAASLTPAQRGAVKCAEKAPDGYWIALSVWTKTRDALHRKELIVQEYHHEYKLTSLGLQVRAVLMEKANAM